MLPFTSFLLYATLCVSAVQGKYNTKLRYPAKDAPQQRAYTVELPVDHFGESTDTFKNRYWVNDEFYKAGGPVIMFDAGEANAEDYIALLSIGQGSDVVADIAQKFGAMFLLWEHRYYGESLPKQNVTESSSLDDVAAYYQYLTFEQALEDVAVFAKNFSLPDYPNKDFRPSNTPWVFIGGSYPGVRAAWMRLRNPDVIYASLSSSAPVQIQEDFWQYWVAIERKLEQTPGYEGCLKDSHAMATWATEVVDKRDVDTAEAFLNAAAVNYEATTDDTDEAWTSRMYAFQSVISASTGEFQNYGLKGGLGQFCDSLNSDLYTNDTRATTQDLKDGIFAYYGVNRSTEIYAAVVHDLLLSMGSGGHPGLVRRSFKAVDGKVPGSFSVTDDLSWTYQTCTEAGFFQIGNETRPTNIIPGFIDLDFWIKTYCTGQFGSSVASGPNVDKSNNKYDGWHLKTSNVFYTNGEYDPWRALSVASDIDPATPHNTFTTQIPAANTPSANGTVFGYLVQNGLHTSDLSYDLTAVRTNTTLSGSNDRSANVAHEIFIDALTAWLPAYIPFTPEPIKNGTGTGNGIGKAGPTGTAVPTGPASSPLPSSVFVNAAAREHVLGGGSALVAVAVAMAFFC